MTCLFSEVNGSQENRCTPSVMNATTLVLSMRISWVVILSNANWSRLLDGEDDDINSKLAAAVMVSVYHALYVAARKIDNGALT